MCVCQYKKEFSLSRYKERGEYTVYNLFNQAHVAQLVSLLQELKPVATSFKFWRLPAI